MCSTYSKLFYCRTVLVTLNHRNPSLLPFVVDKQHVTWCSKYYTRSQWQQMKQVCVYTSLKWTNLGPEFRWTYSVESEAPSYYKWNRHLLNVQPENLLVFARLCAVFSEKTSFECSGLGVYSPSIITALLNWSAVFNIARSLCWLIIYALLHILLKTKAIRFPLTPEALLSFRDVGMKEPGVGGMSRRL